MKALIIFLIVGMVFISGCFYQVERQCMKEIAEELCAEQGHLSLEHIYTSGFTDIPNEFRCVEKDRTVTQFKSFTSEERNKCIEEGKKE